MKKVIILFILILLPFKLCLASYEEQWGAGPYPPYKRLRVEQAESETPSALLPNQWNTLPYEVLVTAFDYLSFRELGTAKLVCKYWSIVAKDETLSVENHYFKRSYACLVRKIDQSQKIQEYVKKVISKYVEERNFVELFFLIPDFLHKSLLIPSTIAQILRTPQLMFSLFKSDIKASQIYTALHHPSLDKEQQETIESYIRLKPILIWEGNIFSKEFLYYTRLYRPYYKALYLFSLFQLPSGSPIYTLLNIIRQSLKNAQAYIAKDEKQALWLPHAMLQLEIPPIDNYKISFFCYKWAVNSSNSTLRKAWEEYEERFLYSAALGNIPSAQYRLGSILYKRGNYRNAELLLRQASNQGNIKAQYALGSLLLRQGRYQEAKTFLYQAAIKGHLFAHFALAQLRFQQGHLEKAKAAFRQVAEQASGKVLYELAQLLKEYYRCGELELIYRQIVSYTPFDQQHQLIILLLSNKNFKPIEPFYRQVLNPGKNDIQYLLADLLNKRGRTILAKQLLEEIIGRKGL